MPEIGASTRFTFEIEGLASRTSVARLDGVEAVSELFRVELSLTSEDRDVVVADMVGRPALLTLATDGSEPRYLHGMVSRFRHVEDGKKLAVYHATLVPRHWRLRRRHDARIFQALAAPAIIERVLEGAGLAAGEDYRLSLNGSYGPREYCVQYRESDFAFVSRLMEEEGIHYFFEHSGEGHVMVLADTPDVAAPIAAPTTLAYRPPLGAMAHGESVSRFSYGAEVRSGKVTLTDFNFKKPGLSLTASAEGELDADLEVYDYPGEYDVPDAGATLSRVRLEEQQARRVTADGESGSIRLTPGYLFSLADHPRDAENRRYLLTRVRHRGAQPQMMESGAEEGPSYGNAFECIPSDVPFRPERRTPRPAIKGVQTAIVTGPGGEEIYTDEHGRVKVHFHWDRVGRKDEKSSCWIRVSQLWAGAGWGAMWIPRVGHEVIVDFVEGDPDRPIIVGRVYHGANVPPYPLPGERTKSTIKSDSSRGGGGSNELRFEDRKGQEEIYLHGQKDWNVEIGHDKSQSIGNDESLDVGHDRQAHVGHDQRETIDHDRTIQVGHDHTKSIDGKESLRVARSRDLTVGDDQTTAIGGNHTITVSKSHDETISVAMTLNVGALSTENVGAAKMVNVGAAYAVDVGAAMITNVGASQSTQVGKNQSSNIGGEKTVVVGKKLVVTCGEASITIEQNGDVTVSGKKISIKGSGPISVEGSKIQVKSDGAVKVKGGKVGIN